MHFAYERFLRVSPFIAPPEDKHRGVANMCVNAFSAPWRGCSGNRLFGEKTTQT